MEITVTTKNWAGVNYEVKIDDLGYWEGNKRKTGLENIRQFVEKIKVGKYDEIDRENYFPHVTSIGNHNELGWGTGYLLATQQRVRKIVINGEVVWDEIDYNA